MSPNQISHFRKLKSLSQEKLGQLVGLTKFQVSRLESGQTELTVQAGRRIANVLGITLDELAGGLEDGKPGGFSEDIVRYEALPGDRVAAALASEHVYLFTVATDALSRAGFPKGMVVQISDSAEDCRNVKPLDAVMVMYHPTGSRNAINLLRQFVPPRMLITNSATQNLPAIDMDTEDATIIGVIIGAYQRFTR